MSEKSEVVEWLSNNGLKTLVQQFIDRCISLNELMELNTNELLELSNDWKLNNIQTNRFVNGIEKLKNDKNNKNNKNNKKDKKNNLKTIKDSNVKYLASLSNGIFGSFYYVNNKINNNNNTYCYKASYNSGIFGYYNPRQKCVLYKASNNSGIFGYYMNLTPIKDFVDYPETLLLKNEIKNTIIGGNSINKLGVNILLEFNLELKYLLTSYKKTIKLYVASGSVVNFSGDCIVNAANEGMLGGGGVDGAISSAGGDILYRYRKAVPIIPNSNGKRCLTGDCKLTLSGYKKNRLKCKYVAHAVGPNYSILINGRKGLSMDECDKLLYNSYNCTLKVCHNKNKILKKYFRINNKKETTKKSLIKSIGFCLISAGIFRGPQSLRNVLNVSLNSIKNNINKYSSINSIYIIGYTQSEISTLLEQSIIVFGNAYKEYNNSSKISKFTNKWRSKLGPNTFRSRKF